MASSTSTIRSSDREKEARESLREEFEFHSTADVHRLVLAFAVRNRVQLRRDLLAERLASAFLARLKERHGRHAQIHVSLGPESTCPARWAASKGSRGEVPFDPTEIEMRPRRADDLWFIDLVDPTTGVGITNVYWGDADEFVFPLNAVHFWRTAEIDEPEARRLRDGRTAIAVMQGDGTMIEHVVDADGNSHLLHDDQRATWFLESGPPS
jgi:hypothetical protein